MRLFWLPPTMERTRLFWLPPSIVFAYSAAPAWLGSSVNSLGNLRAIREITVVLRQPTDRMGRASRPVREYHPGADTDAPSPSPRPSLARRAAGYTISQHSDHAYPPLHEKF